ncbi:hypothetical protein CVT26_012682 [Gymnopilus dilepis]|uniref:NADP-dependent oxidoreductase domain-containing protein n=1 Tax=Gymnopilus dilepis TaxID=231916 RepID=A0A409WAR9_9AGAR|nr:hypothetical protein CVT26_012682 [Gymnopilus dilepis]
MAISEQKTALNVILGTGVFGEEGKQMVRVHDINEVGAILDVFKSHGHTELDTSRIYCEGTNEEYLGKLEAAAKGFKLETKVFPLKGIPQPISLDEKGLRENLEASLKALNVDSIELWYLHAPDRTVPFEETMKVVNDLYKEGKFKKFGLSNFASWEVAEIIGICKANGYIQPTVYQGIYNAIHRGIEPELLPCLRKFGISFYAYSPLAGGFFTGRYLTQDSAIENGSRFDPNTILGQVFWKDPYFKALSSIKAVADKHNLTLAEVALRWISHHSQLKREHGDAVIIGGSSLKHIEQNLVDLEKGPLPDDIIKALDEAWFEVQSYSTQYFF